MSTTGIIVEFVIIGIFASIWILLFIMSTLIINIDISSFKIEKETWALLTIGVFSSCYVIGVIFDKLAHIIYFLCNFGEELEKNEFVKAKLEKATDDMRMELMVREGKATDGLEHIRNRLRVTRSISINLLLITHRPLF